MNRMMRDAGAGNCCAFGSEKFSAAMKTRSVHTFD